MYKKMVGQLLADVDTHESKSEDIRRHMRKRVFPLSAMPSDVLGLLGFSAFGLLGFWAFGLLGFWAVALGAWGLGIGAWGLSLSLGLGILQLPQYTKSNIPPQHTMRQTDPITHRTRSTQHTMRHATHDVRGAIHNAQHTLRPLQNESVKKMYDQVLVSKAEVIEQLHERIRDVDSGLEASRQKLDKIKTVMRFVQLQRHICI